MHVAQNAIKIHHSMWTSHVGRHVESSEQDVRLCYL
jgi:hypothetical protein